MKGLLVIVLSFFLFSCNSEKNKNVVYDNSEKNLIDYQNLKIKNSEAKKNFIDGLKNVENIEYENAYSKFIEANKIEPHNVLILNGLANVENLQGKKLEAEKKYKEALKIDSLYIPSYVNYGKLLHEQTKYSDADKILKIGLKHNPKNSEKVGIYYNLTYSNVMLGNCVQAKEYATLARDNSEIPNQKSEIEQLIKDVEKQCVNK